MPPNGEPHHGRWTHSRLAVLAPFLLVLAAYGAFRASALTWGVVRDGLLGSSLGWTALARDAAATAQAFTVVVLLVVAPLRRPLLGWVTGAIGIGTAVVDAGLWAAIGGEGAGASGHAGHVVIAAGFAVLAAVLCRWGLGWALRADGDGYDWARLSRVLRLAAGCAVVVAAAAGVAALLVDQPGFLDRLLPLLAGVAAGVAAGAVGVLLPVIGERRWETTQTRMAHVYNQVEEDRRVDL